MNSRVKYLFKNVGILTISNFASKILVFMIVPLYTSVISTEDVGIYDLVVSTTSLLFPLLSLNIVDALMRFLLDKAKDKEEVIVIAVKFVSISIIPVAVFLFIVSKLSIFNEIHGYELFIFLYYVFSCLNQFFIQFAKGLELVSVMGIAGVIGTVITLAMNLLLLLVFDAGLTGFFIANIVGIAIPVVFYFFKTKVWTYISKLKCNKNLQREMLLFCTPLIATVVGWWVNNASDRYVVTFLCGVSATGMLSVAYKIPSIINTLQGIFIQAWQISAVKEYGEEDTPSFYGKTFVALNALMVIACSLLIILSKLIGYVLYQKDFFDAWQYVPFLLIASVINSSSGFLGPILSAKMDSKSMALSAIYGSIVNIVLNIVLVYLMGIQGATIATVIASLVIYFVRKKAVGSEIIINKYWTVLITWGLLCIQACIEIYASFWWMQLIIIVAIIVVYKTILKESISLIYQSLKKQIIDTKRPK